VSLGGFCYATTVSVSITGTVFVAVLLLLPEVQQRVCFQMTSMGCALAIPLGEAGYTQIKRLYAPRQS
jgi:hypothetical protein